MKACVDHKLFVSHYKLIAFLLACLWSYGRVPAQSPAIRYLHFTRHNFLASNQVNFILQDKKEFRWFATNNGIQRFDGNRWLWLGQQRNSPTSLPDNFVLSFVEDSKDRFWVHTNSGICLLNRNTLEFTVVTIKTLSGRKELRIRRLMQLKDGHVWLITTTGDLYHYDETCHQFICDQSLFPMPATAVYEMVYDSARQRYYMGTDKGMIWYDRTSKYSSQLSALNLNGSAVFFQSIQALYLNSNGQFWFGSATNSSCYDIKKDSIVFCDSTSGITGLQGYTTDRSGITWSYGKSIARLDLKTGKMQLLEQTSDEAYGISFQQGVFLMEDNENTYWISTNNGLYIYNRFQQQFLQHKLPALPAGAKSGFLTINGFIELADHRIMAFTSGGRGVYYFNQELEPIAGQFDSGSFFPNRQNIDIRCAWRDRANRVWIGGINGLLQLDVNTGALTRILPQRITSITEDNKGNLWLGSSGHAVIRRDAVTGDITTIILPADDTTASNNANFLLTQDEAWLWAATAGNGLYKINMRTMQIEKHYRYDEADKRSIPSSSIRHLLQTGPDSLFIASPIGIIVMNMGNDRFQLLTTSDGLPDNNISSLINKNDNNIWFTSDNGISRLSSKGMRVTSYGILEGLTNEMFQPAATTQLSDGRILFGHNEGFSSFNPETFVHEHVPDIVRITGIRLVNKQLNVDSILKTAEGLVLDYSQNFLTIEFSNMSFMNRYHTEYSYQLEGIDKNPIRVSGTPQATYTYLPGGLYTFKVRCRSIGGPPSETVTSFQIRIIPPVWMQWWFYLLGAVILGGLAYLFVRARYQRKIATEQVRTRIARDLHDDMGSTLSTINILSEMAKQKIDNDIPAAKQFIHQISDSSNRIMESMDDIVWNIDPSNNDVETLLSRMREFAGNLLEARGINYIFKDDQQLKNLELELGRRHDFFLIFKEAINNLAKYSDCTMAVIEISHYKNLLSLVIEDNGKGFNMNEVNGGFGLTNMKKRAEALDGLLKITSSPGNGTSIRLSLAV